MWSSRPGLQPLDARSTPDVTTQSVSRRDHRFPGQEPRGGLHCTVTGLSAGVQAPWRWSRPCALNKVFQQFPM